MDTRLQKAEPMGGTRVSLLYADGFRQVLNLAPALRGPIFEPVKEPGFFALLQVESETIRWPNGADIDPCVLRLWAEKGKVLTQEETDAFFSLQESARSVA
jgi:hypothetical protein